LSHPLCKNGAMKKLKTSMNPDSDPANLIREMEGFVELGMTAAALGLVRRALRQPRIPAPVFAAAIDALLVQEDRLGKWTRLVEAAHGRLPERHRPAMRHRMLAFHSSARNYPAALAFIPRKFKTDSGAVDLALTLETLLALGKTERIGSLWNSIREVLRRDCEPALETRLVTLAAEFCLRTGHWEAAIGLCELAQSQPTFSQNAVRCQVEVHLCRALKALELGRQLARQFSRQIGPAEIALPGNDDAIQRDAEKSFERLAKRIRAVLPPSRWKVVGADSGCFKLKTETE
jgi:hypothetical protein